jgi:UDP-3-O-[3-hydroxymyristoyl] glucosamine N-acyltransferase
MSFVLKLSDILELFPDARTSGNFDHGIITGISSLLEAQKEDLSFLGNPKYRKYLEQTRAGILLVPKDEPLLPKNGQLLIYLENPSAGLASVCRLLEEKIYLSPPVGVHPSAIIEPSAEVDPSASVGPFCFIGENSKVGKNTTLGSHCHLGHNVILGDHSRLHPGVKILAHCKIGNYVTLNAGVVIGSEGYGFDQSDQGHQKIPHLGKVIVEDHVEIGANTCIDRARFDQTNIGQGTKIDNLVQIGHNVKIGRDCLIVAQVGISGSVILEDEVIVGGQAGFAGHITVGKGAKIAGQAGITKNVNPGEFLKGNPALPYHLAQRISVLQRKLPDLFNRFAQEKTND